MLAMGGSAADVFAQTAPSSPGRTAPLKCSSYNDAEGEIIPNLKGAAFGSIVPCVARTVEVTSQRITTGMVNYFRPIFYAFLTLVLVLHGVTAVQGEGQMGPRTFLLLVKITAVVYFVEALGGNVPDLITIADIFSIMDGTADIMADAILPTSSGRGFSCDWQQFMSSNGSSNILWAQMDCALGKVLGFAMGSNDEPSMVLAASIFGLLGGFFFGGTFGLAVFFAAVGFLISLLSFVVRVGFAYLNAYFLIGLYVIFAPLFIPLVLMRSTTQYFDNWIRGVIGAVMMPIIVTTYSLFALLIIDKVLFSDTSILKELMDYQYIADAQRDRKSTNLGTFIGDNIALSQRQNLQQQEGAGAYATQNRDPVNPAGFAGANIKLQLPNLEIARARISGMPEDTVAREKAIYTKLLVDLTKMLIVCFVVVTGWKTVAQLMAVLTSSGAGGQALGAVSPSERALQKSVSESRAAMNQVMRNKSEDGKEMGPGGAAGSEFIERLLPTISEGTKTLITGVTR